MPKRTTMLAILAGIVAAIVIYYLISRTRTPAAATPTMGTTPGAGSGAQRTDESRAASIVGAGLGAAGDVVGALA